MPIEVELPDGNIVEFPDGTDNATMERALSSYRARPDFSNVQTKVTTRQGKPQRDPADYNLLERSAISLFGRPGRDFLDAAQHRVGSALHGAAELVQTGMTNAAELGQEYLPSTITRGLATTARRTLESDRQALRAREQAFQRRKEQGVSPTASAVGGFVGDVLPYTVGAPARLGTAALNRLAPAGSGLARRMAAGSAVGGVAGAGTGLIDPATGQGDYATQKTQQAAVGGVTGAMLGPAAELATSGISAGVRRLTQPPGQSLSRAERAAGEILRREAGAAAQRPSPPQQQVYAGMEQLMDAKNTARTVRDSAPISIFTETPSQVPNYTRTIGEETQIPAIMQIEDYLRASQPEAFRGVDQANNLANLEVLQRMAGTPEQMATAKAARTAAVEEPLAQVKSAADIDMSQTLRALDTAIEEQTGRPMVQSGLQDIRNLIAQSAKTPETIYDQGGLLVQEGQPGALVSPKVVDKIRQTIGDMLSGKYGGDSAKALAGARELIDIRDQLVKEAGEQLPSFAQYISAFRNASKPINQMQVGRTLIKKGSGTNSDQFGNPILSQAKMSRAMRDLDDIAQRATRFNKAKASDIITPSVMKELTEVMENLQRAANVARSNAAGNSATAGRTSVRDRLSGADTISGGLKARALRRAMPNWLGGGDTAAFIEKQLNDDTMKALSYLVANPKEARRVLSALDEQSRKTLTNALAVITASTGGAQAATED